MPVFSRVQRAGTTHNPHESTLPFETPLVPGDDGALPIDSYRRTRIDRLVPAIQSNGLTFFAFGS